MSKVSTEIQKLMRLHENANIAAIEFRACTDDGELFYGKANDFDTLKPDQVKVLIVKLLEGIQQECLNDNA